jgi:hypothetical protein
MPPKKDGQSDFLRRQRLKKSGEQLELRGNPQFRVKVLAV